jgi:hypothetical protein
MLVGKSMGEDALGVGDCCLLGWGFVVSVVGNLAKVDVEGSNPFSRSIFAPFSRVNVNDFSRSQTSVLRSADRAHHFLKLAHHFEHHSGWCSLRTAG